MGRANPDGVAVLFFDVHPFQNISHAWHICFWNFIKTFLYAHWLWVKHFKSFVDPQMEWYVQHCLFSPKGVVGARFWPIPGNLISSIYPWFPPCTVRVYGNSTSYTRTYIYIHMQIVSDVKSWVNSISLCAVLRILDYKLYYIYIQLYHIISTCTTYINHISHIYIHHIYHLHQ